MSRLPSNASLVSGAQVGYGTMALFAPVSWFYYLAKPMTDSGIINGIHVLSGDNEFIQCYVLPKSIEGAGDLTGEEGSGTQVYTLKFFVPGDSLDVQDMLNTYRNEELVMLVMDNGNPYLLQFGGGKNPLYFSKCEPASSNQFDGKKGYTVEAITTGRYFYNANATPLEIFLNRIQDYNLPLDIANTSDEYSAINSIVKSKASLIMTAIGYTPGIIYALDNLLFPVSVPFTRASLATRYNATGLPEQVAANVPRKQYDPASQICMGYLFEKASSNLITTTEPTGTGSTNYWGNYSASGVSIQNTSLFGYCREYSVTENTANSQHIFFSGNGGVTGTSPVTQTLSFHVKANGRTSIALSNGVVIDLSTGTVTSGTAEIKYIGNGWYQIITSKTVIGTSITWTIQLRNGSGATSYTGDGISGIKLRMLQLENSNIATSYMPSYGTSGTRAVEYISFDQVQQGGYMGDLTGAMFTDISYVEDAINTAATGMAYLPDSSLDVTNGYDLNNASWYHAYAVEGFTNHSGKIANQFNGSTVKEYQHGNNTVNDTYTLATKISGIYLRGQSYPIIVRTIALFKSSLLNAELATISS